MNPSRIVRKGAPALCAMLALTASLAVACGDDGDKTVSINQDDGAITAPAALKPGTFKVEINNAGSQPHDVAIVRLAEGVTPGQFAESQASPESGTAIGFVIAEPGGRAAASLNVNFTKGTYVIFDGSSIDGDPSHVVSSTLTVS